MYNQYVLILVWLGFMALLQGRFYREEYNELIDDYDWRVNPVFAFMVMLPVIWMATNRGYFADTGAYISGYQSMPGTFVEIPEYLLNVTKDKGFYLMSAIFRVLFGQDYIPYLFVIALFQSLAIIKLYRKYSVNYVLSIFLFIASTDYISWMFNGIRQFMAVSIIIMATPLMLRETSRPVKDKYLPLLLVILLASTMHQSALLMIPFVIIAQGEAWNKKTLLFIAGALLAMFFVDKFTNILDDTLSATQYVNVVSDYTEWEDDGTNPIRVLVYSIPAILTFVGRNTIRSQGGVLMNFCANMSIISMGLYLISMVTSGIFLGRLPIYCSLYGYVLLPWELENVFGQGNGRIIKLATVIGYILFYYYGMHY